MIEIIIAVIIVSLLVIVLLALPLLADRRFVLKSEQISDNSRMDLNKILYKSRLEELQTEQSIRHVDETTQDNLTLELQKTLLQDTEFEKTVPTIEKKQKVIYWAALLLIPAIAIVIYWNLVDIKKMQRWYWLQERSHLLETNEQNTEWLKDMTAEEMVLMLRTRLLYQPDLPNGWEQFGTILFNLKAYKESQHAFTRALYRNPSIQTRMSYVDTLMRSGQMESLDLAEEQIALVLKENKQHEGAQLLLGFVWYLRKDYQKAIDLWESLIKKREQSGKNVGEGIEQLKKQVADAKMQLAQLNNANTANETSSFKLPLIVSIQSGLMNNLDSNHRVFIIVTGDDGQKAPVAVKPLVVSDLPKTLVLTDADAMLPGRVMSNMKTVTVQARVSVSGNAIASKGDLISEKKVIQVKDGIPQLTLEINQVF